MIKTTSLLRLKSLLPFRSKTRISTPLTTRKARANFSTRLRITLAIFGLLFILCSLTGFSLWVAFTNNEVVQNVQYSDKLNTYFDNIHLIVSEENSLEHSYLLDPNNQLITNFNDQAASLRKILASAKAVGNATDQALINQISNVHDNYLTAITEMFAKVQAQGNLYNVSGKHSKLVEPVDKLLTNLDALVTQADSSHQQLDDIYMAELNSTQQFIFVGTPVVLVVGLILLAFFWRFFISIQRQIIKDKITNENLQAVNLSISNALEKEKELNELKSRFISVTSHEFRTPLTGILSSTELLESYGEKLQPQKKVEVFARIKTAIMHMTDLLDNVLVMGKAEAGKLEFHPAPLDLIDFCNGIITEIQVASEGKNEINFKAPISGLVGMFDEQLLRHIAGNLLGNAVKYSPEGGAILFELDLNYQKDEVCLAISDHGIGIPPEDQSKIFEDFHRAKNVSTIPGTGLGLSIVKEAVELHGGQIHFTSEPGVGTTFTVTLPLIANASPVR